jgi:hypothetical protein
MTGAADRHLSARQKLQRRFMANQNVRFPDGQAGFPVSRAVEKRNPGDSNRWRRSKACRLGWPF